MMYRVQRWISLLLTIVFLTAAFPGAPAAAQSDPPLDEEPPPPVVLSVPPVADPHLPSLTLHLDITPQPLTLDQTAAFTLTLANQADDPAEDLLVSLPTPDGASALAGPYTVGAAQGWQWDLGHLDPRATTTLTGLLRLISPPPGDALLLHAQASAKGLDMPIHEVGGALVAQSSPSPATARYLPGASTRLRSPDGRVQVELPPGAADRALTLRYADTPLAETAPPAQAPFRNGFGAFFLDATDDAGSALHQFTQPFTLTVSYTPQQLLALGIAENDLTLTWFDPASQAWQTIPTSVDPQTQTASALVDHFSAFQLGDGSSPSEAFIPSLQGFQASLFTGGTSYSYPIELPSGPSGIKPNLALSYSSAASDGAGGTRLKQQAGWVGQGWSLDTGSVAANKMPNGQVYYTLVVDGQSYDLMRGAALPGGEGKLSDPTDWDWRATDESFIRVRVIGSGASTSTRGGFHSDIPYPRYTWQVWTKDGTRYDFSEDLWWGWEYCGGSSGDYAYLETYKWALSQVTDPHGNTISYSYGRDSVTKGKTCFHVQGTVDRDLWPSAITWGGNLVTGASARYRVTFVTSARANDTQYDGADNQYGGLNGQPRQTRRLDAIQVWSMPAASWQLVRQYNLTYDYSLLSDALVGYGCAAGQAKCADPNYPRLTLKSIQRVGNNGSSALPVTTFGYGAFSVVSTNGSYWTSGSANRLTAIDNGQGGIISLVYTNVGQVVNNGLLSNQRRLASKSLSDGRGHSYSWSYSYGTPALNSLGTTRGGQSPWGGSGWGAQSYPNSAGLYYNAFTDVLHNSQDWLAHKPLKEFRGHDWVQETNPSGARTKHYFYQGEALDKCTPTATGAAITADACFQRLRDGEVLKGKEYRMQLLPASGSALLQESLHSFGVVFYDYSATPLAGLWRAFSYESQTSAKTYDPADASAAPSVQTTTYTYDVTENTNSNGGVYGNLSKQELFDADGNRQRIVRHYYAIHDTASVPATGSPYIVDRAWADYTWDGSSHSLAYTAYFYDNGTTQASIGATGNLTRQSAFYDLPSATSPTGVIHSRDTTYSYDSYGNRLIERTYAQAGTAQLTNSWSFSAPGNSSAARTTSSLYDDPSTTGIDEAYSGLPIQQTNPLNQITRADYDYRMGTLLRVTGPNTTTTPTDCSLASYSIPANEESSCAQYDSFGRLVRLVKPGDSTSFPTVQATYYDTEQPFRYRIDRRETAGAASTRIEQQFYDGLGRKIQTKSESVNGTQNIVLDTRYDGLARVTASSQPRYVNETASSFVTYTNPGTGALYNQTTTSYDGLGRPLDVQGPDLAIPPTKMRYSLGSLGVIVATTDSNSHKVERETDEFGRLRLVREYSGTSSYSLYATTTYAYDALDQLTRVTDAGSPAGNVTTLNYDSLGRKTQLDDPDMGTWDYTYDANGNLLTQTDNQAPSRQTLWFGYDALDRLTQKRQSSSGGTLLASYGYDAGTNGKGHRTSMSVAGGASESWVYDAGGRKTQATHSVPGLTGTRVFAWAYDSADRITTLTYPIVGTSTEIVTYQYDAAWRPVSACTNLGGCYAQSALYTALDQPDRWTLGNNLIQNWSYSSPLQRLSQLQVGTSSSAGSIFDRSYTYDNVGNVDTLVDNKLLQTQNFDYDHLDRLTHAWTTGSATAAYDETYSYNTIGNLTNKDGVAYSYPASGATSVHPHAPTSVGGTSYVYDGNGNLTSGTGRTYTWTFDNMPLSVSQTSGSESYSYDGDGERVKIMRGTTTTVYLEGLWEEVASGAAKAYYTFNGQTVALRDRSTNVVTYLHGDHLGSVSVATTSGGALASQQEYTPFGSHRGTGDITQTSLDYTGQRLDGTGLLYYHARYYDPALGRFVSPDTIVPGAGALLIGSGSGAGGGPATPQNLNRYTYVTNNPLRYGDPSGHSHACLSTTVCYSYDGPRIQGGGSSRWTDAGGSGGTTVAQAAVDVATVVVAAETLAGGSPDAPSAPEAGSSTDTEPVQPGDAGSYGELDDRAVKNDDLTPHHMPQAALGHTGYKEGGALVLPHDEHKQTRTYGPKGNRTKQDDADTPFRDVLAKDFKDVRRIAGSKYNKGLKQVADYYRKNFPDLMRKGGPQ